MILKAPRCPRGLSLGLVESRDDLRQRRDGPRVEVHAGQCVRGLLHALAVDPLEGLKEEGQASADASADRTGARGKGHGVVKGSGGEAELTPGVDGQECATS